MKLTPVLDSVWNHSPAGRDPNPPSQTGTWRILDQQNQTTTLNFREFTPLLGDIKWALPDPVTFEPSVLHMPEWTIPLTLRSDVANTSRPDLWVIEDHDKAPFRDWLTQANGDIRESFRYGVLAKPGPLLLLRIREIPANSAGDPPGRAFFISAPHRGFIFLKIQTLPGSRSRNYPPPFWFRLGSTGLAHTQRRHEFPHPASPKGRP